MAAPAFDFTSGSLPAGATLTRASQAYRTNTAGLMELMAANAARFDYDPLTLALRGLRIEPAGVNLLAAPTNLLDAAWTAAGLTAVATAGGAPDGSGNAYKLRETNTLGTVDTSRSVRQRVSGFDAGQALALSWYDKQAERANVRHRLTGSAGISIAYSRFSLATGTVSNVDGGTAAIAASGSGMYRAMVAGVTTAAGYLDAFAYLLGPAGELSYNGDGSSGLLVAWPQLEVGPAATSFMPGGSRAADVLTLNWGSKGAADGACMVRYTFDDGSTQVVAATVASGTAVVPTNLNRSRIRTAEHLILPVTPAERSLALELSGSREVAF
jgi:hypothetical protein